MKQLAKNGDVTAFGFRCGLTQIGYFSAMNRVTMRWDSTCYILEGFMDGVHFSTSHPELSQGRAIYAYYKNKLRKLAGN